MDWHEATQRQVGAPGIGEVRRLLADARAEAARQRQDRNVVVAVLAALVMVAMLVVGLPTTSAAQPLPPGTYTATTPGGDVQVTVTDDGAVDVDAPTALVVELAFDADGRVLDTFTVSRGRTTWDVALDVPGDGTYEVDVLRTDDGDVRGPLRFPGPGEGLLDDGDQRGGDRGSSDAAARVPAQSSTRSPDDAPVVTEQRGGAAGGTAAADAPGAPTDGPAQTGGTPDRSGDAPDRTDRAEVEPGRSGDAPGQVDDPPGRTQDPPGKAGAPPGRTQAPPGQADPPGQAEDRARGGGNRD